MTPTGHSHPTSVSVVRINGDARGSGRATAKRVTSSLGQVVDLSVTGMRIVSRGKSHAREGDVIPMSIHTPTGVIAVTAEVVWTAKTGLLRHEAGLRFTDLTDKTRQNLEFTLKLCRIENSNKAA